VIVVSDASPLVALSAVGKLDLLAALYGEVVVPAAVYREAMTDAVGQPGHAERAAATWLRVEALTDRTLVESFAGKLDPGEAEAIALAVQLSAELLLVDERKARQIALGLGIPITGVLGILAEAKQRGLIPSVKTVGDQLMDAIDFRLSQGVYEQVLRALGEI
jgi:predicted nucleic acid-binding protein